MFNAQYTVSANLTVEILIDVSGTREFLFSGFPNWTTGPTDCFLALAMGIITTVTCNTAEIGCNWLSSGILHAPIRSLRVQ
jgi:hypothetical protein